MSSRKELWIHLARWAAAATLLGLAGDSLLAVPAAVGVFFAGFAFAHDLTHGALGLRGRASRLALTLVGGSLFVSGQGMQISHLHHHRHPLADDDWEGRAATLSFVGACLASIPLSIAIRWTVLTLAPRARRLRVGVESFFALASLAAAFVAPCAPLRTYAVVSSVLHFAMPLWAGYLAHRTPPWIVRIARAFARSGSPTVLALAFHDAHHRAPKVPCRRLLECA